MRLHYISRQQNSSARVDKILYIRVEHTALFCSWVHIRDCRWKPAILIKSAVQTCSKIYIYLDDLKFNNLTWTKATFGY